MSGSTENSQAGALPLAGVRIIAVEQYGAGPFGTQHLADLGAEIIKIENRADGGDVGRHVGPYYFAENDSHFYQAFNRNKRSMTLNLKSEQGMEILHRLVKNAAAVFNNLRGDLPEKLRLTYEDLKHLNPQIVCGHLSAYGRQGSRKSWPGYDYLMQAEAGYLSLTGEPQGPPSRMGLSIIDLMTGTTAAMGLLAGILGARATGVGRDIDVSLYDVAIHNLAYVGTWYLNEGFSLKREPFSSHPSLTPSQLYTTADGWIFLMCNKEKFWGVLCGVIEQPEWIAADRYKDFKSRLANRDQLKQELESVLARHTTQEWMTRFAGKVPAAPVYDVAQALDNDFILEQERILELAHPSAKVRAIASPVRAGPHPVQAAPAMGQDNQALLTELGYSDAQIQSFLESAVI
ncbi:CaiB/BaiF CoA transferase family protein [Advenella kashmirensis]